MLRFLTLGVIATAISVATGTLNAGPPTREEVLRRAAVIQQLKQSLAAETSAAEKAAAITELMVAEPDPNTRRMVLDAAIQARELDFDALLTKILVDDADAGIRSRAATALGGLGTKDCFDALAHAAAEDPTTDVRFGDIGGKSSARRDAMFAIAALVRRYPKLSEDAAAVLRDLTVPDPGEKDPQSLVDTRIASLYQVTRDEKLLRPFYDRLKSDDAKTRVRGVVAFQFCELRTAPPELTAALEDESAEVRSWAALVLGRIADRATVPMLLAAAVDSKREIGVRCNAIHSLGRMRAAETTEAMRKLLKDENEAVQAQAAIALYRITGEKVPQFPEGYNAE